jgi:glutathione synthase/RimK-type ligase-like ATP-grasp enzyme
MKPLAIHARKGSFSDRWIEFCQEYEVPYTLVNCYHWDVMDKLRETSALLWHIGHGIAADILMGRHVLNAAELMGLAIFPNHATQWYFDDKIAQKYLLESIGAPLVPTYVFFDLQSAREWINKTSFPKVFKLRRGSGSRNVRLVRNRDEAWRLVCKAFYFGYKPTGTLLGSAWKVKQAHSQGKLWDFLRVIPARVLHRLQLDFLIGRERGYGYFQNFIPNNDCDTRITIIGNRAFGFRRRVRPNDFRASGSGQILYDHTAINLECIRIAFWVAHRIEAQSMAFDFVQDMQGQAHIMEVSFGYDPKPVFDCGGFWDSSLTWHDTPIWPEYCIIEDILSMVRAT